jgi:phosphoserine aminotransferase
MTNTHTHTHTHKNKMYNTVRYFYWTFIGSGRTTSKELGGIEQSV